VVPQRIYKVILEPSFINLHETYGIKLQSDFRFSNRSGLNSSASSPQISLSLYITYNNIPIVCPFLIGIGFEPSGPPYRSKLALRRLYVHSSQVEAYAQRKGRVPGSPAIKLAFSHIYMGRVVRDSYILMFTGTTGESLKVSEITYCRYLQDLRLAKSIFLFDSRSSPKSLITA
jgi:hypothetical protein